MNKALYFFHNWNSVSTAVTIWPSGSNTRNAKTPTQTTASQKRNIWNWAAFTSHRTPSRSPQWRNAAAQAAMKTQTTDIWFVRMLNGLPTVFRSHWRRDTPYFQHLTARGFTPLRATWAGCFHRLGIFMKGNGFTWWLATKSATKQHCN